MERYYLRTFGGSFTENFYGLKRERVLRTKNGEVLRAQLGASAPVRETLQLRTSDIWRNLVVMVGIPYLKRKFDEGYDVHIAPHQTLVASGGPRYHPDDSLPPNPTVRQRITYYYKWFLRNVYPSLNAAYHFSILAFSLAYLFDNTKYPSPFLWLIGTRIRRLGPADYNAIEKALASPPSNSAAGTAPKTALSFLYPSSIYSQLLRSLKLLLPTSIFALKFLEWWHASDFSRQLAQKATETLDLPAPVVSGMPAPPRQPSQEPKSDRKSSLKSSANNNKCFQPPISAITLLPIFTVPLPRPDMSSPPGAGGNSVCPICLNNINNPTACQTGYVFCYTCVFRWLNGDHDRQIDFMNGEDGGSAWDDDSDDEAAKGGGSGSEDGSGAATQAKPKSREGRWESGKGRCPITGRRVLAGTDGLRRVLV